jgi:hypothetical protein
MPYCSIDEAFPDTAQESGSIARKEERKRAKKCGGPALAFLKGMDEDAGKYDLDPDRQNLKPLPPSEKLVGSEGFVAEQNSQWKPKKETESEEEIKELVKNLVGQRVDDIIGQKGRNTMPRNLPKTTELPDRTKTMYGEKVPSYFGKSESDYEASNVKENKKSEGFADFSKSLNDNPGYQLGQADFLGSFGAVGVNKASGKATLTTPSVNDAWKPLTPSGARSSFFEYLPSPGGQAIAESTLFSKDEKETLLKKLDLLFARLEDLESKRNEYAHAEISLFVFSGLFLLFGIESLRKM